MNKVELLAALPENLREDAGAFIDSQNPIGGITNKDEALAFIESNPLFVSAFDSKVSKSISAFEVNNQIKVDAELQTKRAELEKEFLEKANPTMSEEQKQMKLMQEKLESMTNESIKDKQLLIAREHVKGKIYDGVSLDLYLGKTDLETIGNLDKMLLEPYSLHTKAQEEKLGTVVNGLVNDRLNIKTPNSGNKPANGQISRKEFESMDAFKKADTVKKGVQIIN